MIYRIDNVFDNERRKDILERSKKYLKSQEDFDVKFLPGKQTSPRLHTQISFATEVLQSIKDAVGLDLDIKKSWVNWTNGKKKDVYWHTHNSHYDSVYYLKTPLPFFSNGTLFEDKFYKAPQNSILLFPGHMRHTAPTSLFRLDRYSLGMELMKR